MEKKSTLQFLAPYAIGLIAIRLLIDTIIKQFELGYQGEFWGGVISFFIIMGFVSLTIFNYKTYNNNNQLKFIEGIKVGIGLVLIVGVIYTLYIFLIHAKLDPTYQERILELAVEEMKKNNPNADTSFLKNQNKDSNLGIAFWIIKYIFIGVLGGVVTSAILKTEK